MTLNEKAFVRYKLFNSSFTGLSIGITFAIYKPLDPMVYSVGGIFLALGMLFIAIFYDKLLNIKSFYYISLAVELIMMATIVAFIILQFSLFSALLIYIGYQLTFTFGGYLVRAETLVAQDKKLLGKIDVYKQLGYLIGLGGSFLYYLIIEHVCEVTESQSQVSILHFFLLGLQGLIVLLLLSSFKRD